MGLIKCPSCNKDVSSNAVACPTCGEPIDTAIKCPKCGSKSTTVISGASKVGSIVMWGILSANKVMSKYECLVCHHKF